MLLLSYWEIWLGVWLGSKSSGFVTKRMLAGLSHQNVWGNFDFEGLGNVVGFLWHVVLFLQCFGEITFEEQKGRPFLIRKFNPFISFIQHWIYRMPETQAGIGNASPFQWEARKQARYIAIGTDKKSSSPCKERGDLVIGTLIGSSETPKLPNHPNPKDMFFPGEKWTFGWMVRFLQSSGHRGFWVWVRKITPQNNAQVSYLVVSCPTRRCGSPGRGSFCRLVVVLKLSKCPGCTHGFGGTKCQVKVLRWNGFFVTFIVEFQSTRPLRDMNELLYMKVCFWDEALKRFNGQWPII